MVKLPRKTAIFLILLLSMEVHGQTTTTSVPTTTAPTTGAPTTSAPTTSVPTTVAPVTPAPNTVASTKASPTTTAPTTTAPTTTAPSTTAHITVTPTKAAPTTPALTTGTSACVDKGVCTVMSADLCKYPGVVKDCPLLCHSNSSCNAKVCKDAPSCAGQTSAVCRYQGVVDDCPMLCHANSTCDVTGLDGIKVKVSFKLKNKVFNYKLNDEKSQEFIDLKSIVEKLVKDGLISELGNRYLNSEVKRFKKGSVVADIIVTITEELHTLDEAYELVSNALRTGVSTLVSSNVSATGCGEGFVEVNNECLKFSSERLTWVAAKEQCQLVSSTLVVPDDFAMMASYIVNNNLFYWQYWVGASDESNPGNYKWIDGTAVDSSNWYPGYPPASGALGVYPGLSCVKLHPNSNIDKGLIASWDSNCNSTNTFRYICEEL